MGVWKQRSPTLLAEAYISAPFGGRLGNLASKASQKFLSKELEQLRWFWKRKIKWEESRYLILRLIISLESSRLGVLAEGYGHALRWNSKPRSDSAQEQIWQRSKTQFHAVKIVFSTSGAGTTDQPQAKQWGSNPNHIQSFTPDLTQNGSEI